MIHNFLLYFFELKDAQEVVLLERVDAKQEELSQIQIVTNINIQSQDQAHYYPENQNLRQ